MMDENFVQLKSELRGQRRESWACWMSRLIPQLVRPEQTEVLALTLWLPTTSFLPSPWVAVGGTNLF